MAEEGEFRGKRGTPATVAAAWSEYRRRSLPPTIDPRSQEEARVRFYAGAMTMHHLVGFVMSRGGPGAFHAWYHQVEAEFEAFEREIDELVEEADKS